MDNILHDWHRIFIWGRFGIYGWMIGMNWNILSIMKSNLTEFKEL